MRSLEARTGFEAGPVEDLQHYEVLDRGLAPDNSLFFLMSKFGEGYEEFQAINKITHINYDRLEFRSPQDAREFRAAFESMLKDPAFRLDHETLASGSAPEARRILALYQSERGRFLGAPDLDVILSSTDARFDRHYPETLGGHEFRRPPDQATIEAVYRDLEIPFAASPVSAPTLHVVIADRPMLSSLATAIALNRTSDLGAALVSVDAVQRSVVSMLGKDWSSYQLAGDGATLSSDGANDRIIALTQATAMRIAVEEARSAARQRLDIVFADSGLSATETAALADELARGRGYRVDYHIVAAHPLEREAARLLEAASAVTDGRELFAVSRRESEAAMRGAVRLLASDALDAADAVRVYDPSLRAVFARENVATSWRDVATLRARATDRMLTPVAETGADVRDYAQTTLGRAESRFRQIAGAGAQTPATAVLGALERPQAAFSRSRALALGPV